MNMTHELLETRARLQTRRHFLGTCQLGLGAMAMSQWLPAAGATKGLQAGNPLAPREPMLAPKAKRVIYLHMAGSPPQHDLFDYKPELVKRNMQSCPEEMIEGKQFAFIKGVPKLLGTPHKFKQHGESGAWLSDQLPLLAEHVDDLCFVKSMTTNQFNHAPAQLLLHTGNQQFGGASMGAWITYGLGSLNEDLPGFIVMVSRRHAAVRGQEPVGKQLYLPSVYQGVQCRSKGDPILYVSNPEGDVE